MWATGLEAPASGAVFRRHAEKPSDRTLVWRGREHIFSLGQPGRFITSVFGVGVKIGKFLTKWTD
jgi:hypothetical protein